MYEKILVGYLDTEQGRDALELGRVLGATYRGPLGRVVPGATTGRLLGEAPCAVAVAPPGFGRTADGYDGWRPLSGGVEDAGLRVIGVGFDGSHAAREALETAVELALSDGSAMRVYTVARNYARPPAAGAGAGTKCPACPAKRRPCATSSTRWSPSCRPRPVPCPSSSVATPPTS